jgi:2-amino-4-hydroxy-6-hydroxymethyldihydropteridine diphosphokinase
MNDVYLSIGSNIGNRLNNINKSISFLKENGIVILKKSSIYLTEPKGYNEQIDFYNIVVLINTNLNIDDFFSVIRKIEISIGKKNNHLQNRPRIIDIDILTFGSQVIQNSTLTIPHARLNERKFVLIPWNELDSRFLVPFFNKTVFSLLNAVDDSSKVCKLQL